MRYGLGLRWEKPSFQWQLYAVELAERQPDPTVAGAVAGDVPDLELAGLPALVL
jgi:hypothetical protein